MAGFSTDGNLVSVSGTAGALAAVSGERELLVFTHVSGGTVYFGDGNVSDTQYVFSTSAGDRVIFSRERPGDVALKSPWYGVCASGGSAQVNVGEVFL